MIPGDWPLGEDTILAKFLDMAMHKMRFRKNKSNVERSISKRDLSSARYQKVATERAWVKTGAGEISKCDMCHTRI